MSAVVVPNIRRLVTVETRQGWAHVWYRPNDITLSDYDGAEIDPKGTARRLICSCVARWNLESGGQTYPITAASVRLLSDKLALDIASAIAVDMRAVLESLMRVDAA